MKVIESVSDLYGDFITKKNNYVNNHIDRYVIRYEVIDSDHIKVWNNINKYRVVRNTSDNLKKLDRVIIKNKVNIAHKIDEYEEESNERTKVLLLNTLLICISGSFVFLSLFLGSYLIILLSLISFSMSIILGSINSLQTYLLISEMRNLKKCTGYKLNHEIVVPKLNLLRLSFKKINN